VLPFGGGCAGLLFLGKPLVKNALFCAAGTWFPGGCLVFSTGGGTVWAVDVVELLALDDCCGWSLLALFLCPCVACNISGFGSLKNGNSENAMQNSPIFISSPPLPVYSVRQPFQIDAYRYPQIVQAVLVHPTVTG